MSELNELLNQILGRGSEHAGTGPGGPAWTALEETGLTRVGIATSLGGSGGDLRDATVVAVRAAQAGLSGPLTEGLFPVADLAAAADEPVPAGLVTIAVLPASGRPVADGVQVAGIMPSVPWGRAAHHLWLVVPRGDATALLPLAAGEWTSEPGTNLAGEPRDTVTVDLVVEPSRLRQLPDLADERAHLWSAFGRGAQILGAAQTCLRLTREHVVTRRQFGAPLASRQVVQHAVAALACEVAAAQTAVAHALDRLTTDSADPAAVLAVAAAKVQTARSATRVARTAHQMHGAIGTAAEHPLHHATTRLWAWRGEAGTAAHWAARIAGLVHGEYGSDLWATLTA